jgi:hypothetical protein
VCRLRTTAGRVVRDALTLLVLIAATSCTGPHGSGASGRPDAAGKSSSDPGVSRSVPPVASAVEPLETELRGPNVRLDWVAYAGADQGVASWVICPINAASLGPCASRSVRTRDGWGSSAPVSELIGDAASATTDGSVAWWFGPKNLGLLEADGLMRRIRVSRQPQPAADDAAIFGSSWSTLGVETDLWALAAGTRVAHPVPASEHIETRFSAIRAGGGRLWVQGWDENQDVWVAWSDDGGLTWSERLVASRGYPGGLALGSNGQVAAFAWNDVHATNTLTGGSILTYNNGRTWTRFHLPSGPEWVTSESLVGGPGGVATMPDGTIFVVDQQNRRLWTSTGDWQTFRQLPGLGRVDWIQSNGSILWAGHGPKQILVSHDEGDTWATISPG